MPLFYLSSPPAFNNIVECRDATPLGITRSGRGAPIETGCIIRRAGVEELKLAVDAELIGGDCLPQRRIQTCFGFDPEPLAGRAARKAQAGARSVQFNAANGNDRS